MSHFSTGAVKPRVAGPYVSDEALLKQQARAFMEAYPDAYGLAYATAKTLLHKHTNKALAPDKVWWHRFGNAASSPRTFTGWEHFGTPVESMTLIELVMRRFNAHDQDASDELQLYGGFYTDGPQHGVYDERNEVAMLPGQLLVDFWALDFATMFQQRVSDFWAAHGDTFCALAKARLLAAAGLAVHRRHLSPADFQVLQRALSAGPAQEGSSLRSFDIGGFVSSEIIRVVDAGGRQILYLPGETPAFHVCETERDLYAWVRQRLMTEQSCKAFKGLFLRSALARQAHGEVFDGLVAQIRAHRWDADRNLVDTVALRLINRDDQPIAGDFFEHLRNLAQQDMQSAAQAILTSNTSLRKQMWIGYLNAFIRVFGPTAVLGWPLALTLVGAGLANVGLNIDQAVNGASASQRKAGVTGAILNSIFILFNLPLLMETGAAIEPLADDLSATSMEALDVEEARPMQRVEQTANGETWIELNEVPRRVRYSSALRAWLVVDLDNPFTFTGGNAVRLDAQGHWEMLPPLKLQGGGPMEAAATSASDVVHPFPTRHSPFWDIHMQLNADEEERLSELAVARQKAVINVREMSTEDELSSDSEGEQTLVDVQGNTYRTFKTVDGRYIGGRIAHYTRQEDDFNVFLRTGVEHAHKQVKVIEELAEDLATVGCNNHVTLYRGGSGARGTSGVTFRAGRIKAGDVLVNTDFTSFSENPYVARAFASSQAGAPSYGFSGPVTFDDTSIVFELPAERYLSATPIAPFATDEEEAESLFTPGHYFQVQSIREVVGPGYKFMHIQMREVVQPSEGTAVYDLRTGEPFSRAQYATRLGPTAQAMVDRFFPLPSQPVPHNVSPHP